MNNNSLAAKSAKIKYEQSTRKENFTKITISKEQKVALDALKDKHKCTLIQALDVLIGCYNAK